MSYNKRFNFKKDSKDFSNKSNNENNKNNKNNNFRNNSNNNKKTNTFKNNKNNDFSPIYKIKFEKDFGNGSFNKLLNERKEHSNGSFIRINVSRIFPKKIEDFLIKNRVKFSKTFLPNSLKIEKSFFNISSSLPSMSGEIYLQDLASQIPINLIDFDKFKGLKIEILDMAASPGSKTSQIADLCEFYNIDYKITALEIDKKRILRLINNLQKQSFSNIDILNISGELFTSLNKFDIILLDAPCSGNLIGDKDWLLKRDFQGIEKKSKIQKKLLNSASKLLKKEGILIYSTCSLEKEENEENVLWVQNNTGLKSIPINYNFNFEIKSSKIFFDDNLKKKYLKINSMRFQPYYSKTQGFFVAIFKN